MFEALARFCYRHRIAVLIGAGLSFLASLGVLFFGARLSTTNIDNTESDQAFALIDEELHQPVGSSFTVIFRSSTWTWDDPRFEAEVRRVLEVLEGDERIAGVQTPYSQPEQLSGMMRSSDGRGVIAMVSMREPFEKAAQYFAEIRESLQSEELELVVTGSLAFKDDLDHALEKDLIRSELVAVPLAILVLLWVFGSLVAAVVPVLIGGLAILGGMAVTFLLSYVTDITQYSLNIVSLIGTGVAIDYSLFIVSRFRDELAQDDDVCRALQRTMATAGRAVAFSGFAVAVGLSGLLVYAGSYMSSMGLSGTVVVAMAVLFALTFLPALLAVLGHNVNRLRVFRSASDRSEGWRRVARWVMKHPVLVLVPTLAFTVLVGLPFLRIELRAADVTVLPRHLEARQGFELLRSDFPDFAFDRLIVAVQFGEGSPLSVENLTEAQRVSREMAALPQVKRVESIVDVSPMMGPSSYAMLYNLPEGLRPDAVTSALRQSVGRSIILMSVVSDGNASAEQLGAVIRGIRGLSPPPGGRLWVTGQPAVALDSMDFIAGHTPTAMLLVLSMMLVILVILLRSVLLPLAAVVMNALSITASFGALVWIFQDGHFASILGFEPAPIEPTLPVILFCAVFGLSMDYQVLMLSRIQELYRKTGDNREAVAEGLARSAPLITSAAAIMVAVFAAFVVADVIFLKAVGLGVAIAVVLDATLIRVLLVPATMRLLGRANWWAPRWGKRSASSGVAPSIETRKGILKG
jgi:RND superfamily putative drug exporter